MSSSQEPDGGLERLAQEALQELMKEDAKLNVTPSQPATEVENAEAKPLSANDETAASIGRYRLVKELGRGGFGSVYLAHDAVLKRDVALKIPKVELVREQEHLEAFRSEAVTVTKLRHPNIVPVHEVGSDERFPLYVVSEYVSGHDLRTRLSKSRLSIDESVQLIATLAQALDFAHQKGVVHRDLKPGNILLDEDSNPMIVDWGLAVSERDTDKGPPLVGTPAYFSPEQASGESSRVDKRSDIFSLGVVLYELLAGQRPFQADSLLDLLDRIKSENPKPLRQIDESLPTELERICLKSLSKKPSDRYTTAGEMADDLRKFLRDAAESISIDRSSKMPEAATQDEEIVNSLDDESDMTEDLWDGDEMPAAFADRLEDHLMSSDFGGVFSQPSSYQLVDASWIALADSGRLTPRDFVLPADVAKAIESSGNVTTAAYTLSAAEDSKVTSAQLPLLRIGDLTYHPESHTILGLKPLVDLPYGIVRVVVTDDSLRILSSFVLLARFDKPKECWEIRIPRESLGVDDIDGLRSAGVYLIPATDETVKEWFSTSRGYLTTLLPRTRNPFMKERLNAFISLVDRISEA